MKKKITLFFSCAVLFVGSTLAQPQNSASKKDSLASAAGEKNYSPPEYNKLFFKQKKTNNVAAVSEIYSSELQKTTSSTIGGQMSGRLAGLYTYQASGQPGFDDVSVFLRGQSPLIMIDGTPQSFPSINPEQIESITLLKDAVATSMLGMRGGNGAILITTKKGDKSSQKISFTAQYGMQKPTRLPKFAGAADYAKLYNEALANDGIAPVYTQADIDAYVNGSDPTGHPNVDWQKEILRDQAPLSRYDLSISGGNKITRYFVNMDYLQQDGLFKSADFNTYKTNADYQRIILRSNIETDISKILTVSLNLFGRIQNTTQPGAGGGSIFNNFRNTPNNAYPVKNADSSLGGNLDYQSNIYGQSVLTGYTKIYERDFKVDFNLKGNLDPLLKGLWVKALMALNAYQSEGINRSKTFAVYKQSTDAGGIKSYSKYGVTGDQANSTAINSQNRLFYSEFSAGYSKNVGSKDNIDALVVANNDYRMLNSDLAFNYTGISAKVSYDHQQKYFVDITAGYNGTERLPKGKRYGLFPAIGLGWNIKNEAFLKGKMNAIDYLKLRATYGKTGNVNVGYYDYYQYYTNGTGYGFGSTVPSSTTTLQQGSLSNPAITFEKANKLSIGLDVALFKNKLTFSADYFHDDYYDLVQSRRNSSDILGTGYISENLGKNLYTGYELQASWKENKGDFGYFISPNLSIVKSKVKYMAEPTRLYSYLMQTGQPVGQAFGYVSEGLFASQSEINSHAFQGGKIVPGDIKYKDLNSDGVIDANDQQAIGSTKPQIYYGVNTGVSFKGLALSVLLQGIGNANLQVTGYRAFQNNGRGQAYEEQLNRWTPTNTTAASYPRLWVGNNVNNTLTSSYWIQSGAYLRVKNIDLSYTLPSSLSQKAKLSVTRIFLNATNLFTSTSLKNMDPEGSAGGYPIMKVMTAGINIQL